MKHDYLRLSDLTALALALVAVVILFLDGNVYLAIGLFACGGILLFFNPQHFLLPPEEKSLLTRDDWSDE